MVSLSVHEIREAFLRPDFKALATFRIVKVGQVSVVPQVERYVIVVLCNRNHMLSESMSDILTILGSC
jgi:hypothetical protein